VRTLVVSDLHLGGRLEHDVLRRPEPLKQLLDALRGIDRLVLLGDIVELMEAHPDQAMRVAEPVLRAIGERLLDTTEVIYVPGNHDKPLIREWVRARRSTLSVDTVVPLSASRTLARLTSWLWPATVQVRYPGVWLSDRVWATHGHYLDLHLLPVAAWGIARGLIGRPPGDGVAPAAYERARRPSTARATQWLPRPAAELLDELAELIRASTMPRARRHLARRGIAPLNSRLLGLQMRHAAIPAFGRVVHRLGIDAEWAIFGHVHRLGPLDGDDQAEWLGPAGGPRIVNCGSWMYEPALLHRAVPPHPYWPGGAVLLEDGSEPRAVGLLDGLSSKVLH
jgi:UDP-2,3-diacylglucosamine pyrophosphatase LpxH